MHCSVIECLVSPLIMRVFKYDLNLFCYKCDNLLTDFLEQSVEKVVAQLFKEFSAFYGTQKPITMLVRDFGCYAFS